MNRKTLFSCGEQNSCGNKRPRRVASQGGDTKIPRQWLGSCTDRRQRRFQGHRKGAQRPRITAADPTCLFRSAVSVALHLDQVLFILVGNLQTLNSYMEFCFPGRTHAAIHGPDESRRAQQGGGTMIPCQGLGSLYHSVPLDSEGWHSVSRARGWVLAEQASIARGSRVQTKIACAEVPFPLGVLQGDGSLRARHGMMLFADEDIPGFIEGAARATAGSKDEELAHYDVLALADEATCRLPASGWGFFLQHRFVDISPNHRRFQELFPPGDGPAERTLANSRQKVRRD